MVILEEQSTDLIEEPVVIKKATLDQFWKLGQARKEHHDAASKVLQAVAKSEVEAMYTSLVQQRRQTQTGVRSLPY